jgi:hypothetical protein
MPNTLQKINFTNLNKFVNDINANFAIVENSPLFKGIPGQQGSTGQQGTPGHRGTSIFVGLFDNFKATFNDIYMSSEFTAAWINTKLTPADEANVYTSLKMLDNLIEGDMILLSTDMTLYRFSQTTSDPTKVGELISTGISLSLNANIVNTVTTIVRDLVSAQLSNIQTNLENVPFYHFGTVINNKVFGNSILQTPIGSEIFFVEGIFDATVNNGYLDPLKLDPAAYAKYFHTYLGLNKEYTQLDIKDANGIVTDTFDVKTTTILGSAKRFMDAIYNTSYSGFDTSDPYSHIESTMNKTDNPHLERLPCLVVMQNDNESGILLGRLNDLHSTLQYHASIFVNVAEDLEFRLSYGYDNNSNATHRNAFFKMQPEYFYTNKSLKADIDLYCEEVHTTMLNSATKEVLDIAPRPNTAGTTAGNTILANSKINILSTYLYFRYYVNNNGVMTSTNAKFHVLATDADGKVMTDDPNNGYIPVYKYYRPYDTFEKDPSSNHPLNWINYGYDYTGYNDYLKELSLLSTNKIPSKEELSRIVATELSLSQIIKFLWYDPTTANNTKFFGDISLLSNNDTKSYPRNYSNTVLISNLCRKHSNIKHHDPYKPYDPNNPNLYPKYSPCPFYWDNGQDTDYTGLKSIKLSGSFAVGNKTEWYFNGTTIIKPSTSQTNTFNYPLFVRSGTIDPNDADTKNPETFLKRCSFSQVPNNQWNNYVALGRNFVPYYYGWSHPQKSFTDLDFDWDRWYLRRFSDRTVLVTKRINPALYSGGTNQEYDNSFYYIGGIAGDTVGKQDIESTLNNTIKSPEPYKTLGGEVQTDYRLGDLTPLQIQNIKDHISVSSYAFIENISNNNNVLTSFTKFANNYWSVTNYQQNYIGITYDDLGTPTQETVNGTTYTRYVFEIDVARKTILTGVHYNIICKMLDYIVLWVKNKIKNYYTKDDIDTKITTINANFSNYYTSSIIDSKYNIREYIFGKKTDNFNNLSYISDYSYNNNMYIYVNENGVLRKKIGDLKDNFNIVYTYLYSNGNILNADALTIYSSSIIINNNSKLISFYLNGRLGESPSSSIITGYKGGYNTILRIRNRSIDYNQWNFNTLLSENQNNWWVKNSLLNGINTDFYFHGKQQYILSGTPTLGVYLDGQQTFCHIEITDNFATGDYIVGVSDSMGNRPSNDPDDEKGTGVTFNFLGSQTTYYDNYTYKDGQSIDIKINTNSFLGSKTISISGTFAQFYF